jgi:hypothetical protein
MDIAVIVKFLAPCLPFLLTMGNKAAEGASTFGYNLAQIALALFQTSSPTF